MLGRLFVGAGVIGAVALVYRGALAPRLASWGATGPESSETMPGDDVVPAPNHVSTRAIDIDASPGEVWPWLVQMGQGRGGAYSYERLQNLFGLDFRNADRIVPELQGLEVGDTIPLDPSGRGPKVRELVPEQLMLLEDDDPPWTWLFVLRPLAGGGTRLVVRNRVSTRRSSPLVRCFYVALGPPVFVMERGMLRGIKQRAERLHRERLYGRADPSASEPAAAG